MIPNRIAILSAMASLAAIVLTAIDGSDAGADGSGGGGPEYGYHMLAGSDHRVDVSTVELALTVEGGTHSGHHGRG